MVTAQDVRSALQRWCRQMSACAPEFNALDARLGDGDLGATLGKCADLVLVALPSTPDNIADLFKASAKACMAASGSSFGTLLGVGLLSAARTAAARSELSLTDLADMLQQAANDISARGNAKPGDKTFLDTLLAAESALRDSGEGEDPRPAILQAVKATVEAFREKPNRVGRARMFADKSVGLDDPGMVAVLRMVESF